jgi:shikimate dehydrogenase
MKEETVSERVKREVSSIKISGTTKLVGVMGWPISHTLSPQMHNSAFAKMKLDYVYVPLPVAPDRIDSAIHALRAFNMVGANVTIPHKESVVPFMDKLSDAANLVGAVNTIINRNGKLFGHTTDPEGICGALRKAGKKFRNQRVVIMGSGGSARTALFTALMNGANKVTLVARSIDKARKVLSEAKKKFTGSVVMAN